MKNLHTRIAATLIVLAFASLASAQEQLIFPLSIAQFSVSQFAGPVEDSAGNLYVPSAGTSTNISYILQFNPPAKAGGQWNFNELSAVNGSMMTGLAIDSLGNLYGTSSGGSNQYGYAFKLPHGQVQWITMFNFPSATGYPTSTPILDAKGNFYSASYYGSTNCGSIFELAPSGKETWAENVLYSFLGTTDGCQPTGVVMDKHGNLYGQTLTGGANQQGTLFELIAPTTSGGSWTEQTLYTFPAVTANSALRAQLKKIAPPKGFSGYNENTLTIDASGNLYGTYPYGGTTNNGYVFELSPSGSAWTFSTLYNFAGAPDGAFPANGLALYKGSLYGTTYFGGPVTQYSGGGLGIGTLFQLSPPTISGDPWTEKILHNFVAGYDGWFPSAVPIFNSKGVLYGTTLAGGNNTLGCNNAYCGGTVFQFIP